MCGVRTQRAAALFLSAVIITSFGIINAAAGEERLQDTAGPPLDGISAESLSTVRFFTINEVLAARGTTLKGAAAATRIASLESANLRGTLSDAVPFGYPVGPKLGPFGMATFRAPEGLLWVKWRKLAAELRQDEKAINQCGAEPELCSSKSARQISLIVESVRTRVGRARLEEVNRSVNGTIRYVSDEAQHGVPDLWSSALAAFSSGQGDCEDYAIAKYLILRAAGVAAEDLRIMLVRDLAAREAHAVLAARVACVDPLEDDRQLPEAEGDEEVDLAEVGAPAGPLR